MKKKIIPQENKTYSSIDSKYPYYKKLWFWLLVILIITIGTKDGLKDIELDGGFHTSFSGIKSNLSDFFRTFEDSDDYDDYDDDDYYDDDDDKEKEDDPDEALEEAKRLAEDDSPLSEKTVRKILTRAGTTIYTDDAVEYAMDNIDANWDENALRSAKSYAEHLSMSKVDIQDQLTSEYGEGFTVEQAQYAMDHIKVDWKEIALKRAKELKKDNYSKDEIEDLLGEEHGEGFTKEEVQYAMENLSKKK